MVSRPYSSYPPPPPHDGARYLSGRLCAPYSSYSERRYLPSHDARAITMADPQTDDNTPPRKRIAVAVSPSPFYLVSLTRYPCCLVRPGLSLDLYGIPLAALCICSGPLRRRTRELWGGSTLGGESGRDTDRARERREKTSIV